MSRGVRRGSVQCNAPSVKCGDANFDLQQPLLVVFMCSDGQKLFYKSSVRSDPLFVSYLAAELPRSTWHHETGVNFEMLLPTIALGAVACSPRRATFAKDTAVRCLSHHVASLAPGHCVSRSLLPSAAPCVHAALAPSGVCSVFCRAITTQRLPSSDPELIDDKCWRRCLQRSCKDKPNMELVAAAEMIASLLVLQSALDETYLQYCSKERGMHVADLSKQVCLTTNNDKRQLTATPRVS